jgi:hypothetical protein
MRYDGDYLGQVSTTDGEGVELVLAGELSKDGAVMEVPRLGRHTGAG